MSTPDKKTSLLSLSKGLGLSKTTVSLVLNGRGDASKISKKTQARILAYAKEQNYKPNQMARGLSLGKSETIGLIVPDISDTFYARIAYQAEMCARKHAYNIVFCSYNESVSSESEMLDSMLTRQVDGVIVATTQQNDERFAKLKKSKFPCVLFDRHYPTIDFDTILVNNYDGVYSATTGLIKKGYERIGYFTLHNELSVMADRERGYTDALRNAKRTTPEELVFAFDYRNFREEMEAMLESALSDKYNLDCLFFSTHNLALAALSVMRTKHPELLNTLGILCFGDHPSFELMTPSVSALRLPLDKIGNTVVENLLSQIKGNTDDCHLHHYRVDYIERDSTRAKQ